METRSSQSSEAKTQPISRFVQLNPEVEAAATTSLKKLWTAAVLCCLFMIGELAGGWLANSLAILTDAAHLLSDLLGFAISITAVAIGKRPASSKTSFGYHRTEVLGALASISLIWAITVVLVYEAVQRVIEPQEVDGMIMLITAGCGLCVNLLLTKVLHTHGHASGHHHHHEHEEKKFIEPLSLNTSSEASLQPSAEIETSRTTHSHVMNLNVKAALIHVLGDLVQSVGVCVAALIIYFQPKWTYADPICTFLFSVLVIGTTVPILRQCVNILLEQTPKEVNIADLTDDLENIHGVMEMHDLHVWSLSAGKTALSCHLQSDTPRITLTKATRLCRNKYNISHTTIQVEPMEEGETVLDCSNSLH